MFAVFIFFFNDTATTEIYTLSLHDALPIFEDGEIGAEHIFDGVAHTPLAAHPGTLIEHRRLARGDAIGEARWKDRKSTRLNSSHTVISYAVFCLKKKKKKQKKKECRQKTHR